MASLVASRLAVLALSAGLLGVGAHAGTNSCGSAGGYDETFRNPPEIVSQNGVLNATLAIEATDFDVASMSVKGGYVYNGLYTPPTLRMKPGDVIKLKLVNGMSDQFTNIHTHGLNVSPLGNGDNVFLHVMPGETFDYTIALPKTHPAGLFWYHPHAHGFSQFQVYNGMSGGLIVDGLLDPFPQLANIADRTLLLKDSYVQDDGTIPAEDDLDTGHASLRTVNGQANPTLKIRPDELQLWRFGNIGANRYYERVLNGHTMYEIARDGNRHNQLVPMQQILLPPASRSEVLVRGGAPGVYTLRTLSISTGPLGDQYDETTLATLVSEGSPAPFVALPASFPAVPDLRTKPIARTRVIRFQEDDQGGNFAINGKQFDMNRVDTVVQLGDLEEWEVTNETGELHVFHIHQLDFQVTKVNGKEVAFTGYQDNVNVPYADDDGNVGKGSVTLRIPFTDPVIVGKFVYHCHILEHEDGGMMATIEVQE